MGRLIDADELHEIINWTHMKPPFSKKAIHRYIDMARTVEAIPISWLENFRDGLDTLSESQLMRAIDLIIDAYRVEKKRKEE